MCLAKAALNFSGSRFTASVPHRDSGFGFALMSTRLPNETKWLSGTTPSVGSTRPGDHCALSHRILVIVTSNSTIIFDDRFTFVSDCVKAAGNHPRSLT